MTDIIPDQANLISMMMTGEPITNNAEGTGYFCDTTLADIGSIPMLSEMIKSLQQKRNGRRSLNQGHVQVMGHRKSSATMRLRKKLIEKNLDKCALQEGWKCWLEADKKTRAQAIDITYNKCYKE